MYVVIGILLLKSEKSRTIEGDMIVKDQHKRREILIRQENKLLGELPVQEVQLVVSFTQKRKEDYFLTQQKMKEHQDKLDSLPIMIPTEEGLTAIKEATHSILSPA